MVFCHLYFLLLELLFDNCQIFSIHLLNIPAILTPFKFVFLLLLIPRNYFLSFCHSLIHYFIILSLRIMISVSFLFQWFYFSFYNFIIVFLCTIWYMLIKRNLVFLKKIYTLINHFKSQHVYFKYLKAFQLGELLLEKNLNHVIEF